MTTSPMDSPRNLPIVFEEEKIWGLKTSSSYQYELEGKLTEEDKKELLKFANKRGGIFSRHKQEDHLFELKCQGYVLVIDFSGEKDRIHFRTKASKKLLPITFFGGLLTALLVISLSFMSTEIGTVAILMGLFGAITSIYSLLGPNSPRKKIRQQEGEIVKMIRKIDTLVMDQDLTSDH